MIKDDGEIFSDTNNFHCETLTLVEASRKFHRNSGMSRKESSLFSYLRCCLFNVKINFVLNDILNCYRYLSCAFAYFATYEGNVEFNISRKYNGDK